MRAYTTAASRALDSAEQVTVQPVVRLATTVDYPLYERVNLLVAAAGGGWRTRLYRQGGPGLADARRHRRPLLEQLRELTRGQGRVEVSEPFYGAV